MRFCSRIFKNKQKKEQIRVYKLDKICYNILVEYHILAVLRDALKHGVDSV